MSILQNSLYSFEGLEELVLPEALTPQYQLGASLVEITNPRINPYAERDGLRVKIFAQPPPPLTTKALPALEILLRSRANGKLNGVTTLIVPTSGNLGVAIAAYAPYFNVRSVTAVIPNDLAPGKEGMLELFGVYCIKPNKNDHETAKSLAADLARKPGRQLIDQYTHPGNQAAFSKWLAPNLWQKTREKMTILCTALGSTGTALGCRDHFRKNDMPVTVVGVACDAEDDVPGARSIGRLAEIGFDVKTADFPIITDISSSLSYSTSKLMCPSQPVGGPTSGMTLFGGLRFLKQHEKEGTLDQFRNEDGDVVMVVVCADGPQLYIEKYNTKLKGGSPKKVLELL